MTGRKSPPLVTVGNFQAVMSILWEPTKICNGVDSSSTVSLTILVTNQENSLENCIYTKQGEIQVL